jgi:hypothetical protein
MTAFCDQRDLFGGVRRALNQRRINNGSIRSLNH